jgi:hypothetical protein
MKSLRKKLRKILKSKLIIKFKDIKNIWRKRATCNKLLTKA